MPERKAFLLRVDPALLHEVQRWADDELRSLNAQIEYLLRRALIQSGRKRDVPEGALKRTGETDHPADPTTAGE